MNSSNSTIALPKVLISAEQIQERVGQIAQELNQHFAGKVQPAQPLVVIGVLKGAYIFLADLVRQLELPLQIEFIRLSSYGDGTASSGTVYAPDLTLPSNISRRQLLVVEDIVDTGHTATFLRRYLQDQFQPESLFLVSLLNKAARREIPVEAELYGFQIANHFVVGYGLDYAERYRELPYLGVLEDVLPTS